MATKHQLNEDELDTLASYVQTYSRRQIRILTGATEAEIRQAKRHLKSRGFRYCPKCWKYIINPCQHSQAVESPAGKSAWTA